MGDREGAAATVGLDQVRAARELLADVVHTTPVESSAYASGLHGSRVLLKCEHLQRTGSFKLRGAYVRIARLGDDRHQSGPRSRQTREAMVSRNQKRGQRI